MLSVNRSVTSVQKVLPRCLFSTQMSKEMDSQAVEAAQAKIVEEKLDKYASCTKDNRNIILHALTRWASPHLNHCGPSMWSSKLEAFFSYHNIQYEITPEFLGLHPKMHKTPFITYQGEHIADSQLIQNKIAKDFGVATNSHLTPVEKAVSHAFHTAYADNFYWLEIHRRWMNDDNCKRYVTYSFDNPEIVDSMRQRFQPILREQLWSQGTGRFDNETIYEMYAEHIDAVLTFLGDKQYFFGDELSSVDFSLYGMLGSSYALADMPFLNGKEIPRQKEVIDYVKRVEKGAFGELVFWNK